MAAAKKPTAQQKAQAKARAGGNNPIKVTNAGVKRLGKAALIAGSLTPAGRGVKAASMAVKAAKAVSQSAKRAKIMSAAEKKSEAIKIAKTIAKKPESSVKVVKPQGKASNTFRNQKETERLTRNPMPKSTPKSGRGSARPDSEVAKIKISENVTARVPKKSNYDFAKDMSTIGKIQKQNAGPLKATKAEVKANARGLKAANKPKGKKMSSKDIKKFEKFIDVQIKKL
jgi:hypothetical protein